MNAKPSKKAIRGWAKLEKAFARRMATIARRLKKGQSWKKANR